LLIFWTTSICIGSLAALILAEVVLRLANVRYATAPLLPHQVMHHVHPSNYAYIVHDPKKEFGGHKVRFDKEGLVADPDRPQGANLVSSGNCRIAFMGDSFTEAIQVPFQDSFAGRIARRNREVKNFGVSSYSPILYVLQWRQAVRAFKPAHVFLLLYSNDVREDLEYLNIGKLTPMGHLEAVPGPELHGMVELLRHSYLFRYLRKTQREFEWLYRQNNAFDQPAIGGYVEENPDVREPTTGFIKALWQEMNDANTHLVLAAVPSKLRLLKGTHKDQGPEFSERWRRWAQETGIDFLDLTTPFREASLRGEKLFFDQDIHFTAAGHKVIEEAIANASSFGGCPTSRTHTPIHLSTHVPEQSATHTLR
jgi:lysophospholipase L1-like esterase